MSRALTAAGHPGYAAAMEAVAAGGLMLLRFPGLAARPGLVHGVSTRGGGVSAPPYGSLNLSFGGDAPQAVEANRERLRAALGLERLAWNHQVHGTRIRALEDAGGADGSEADGLATNRPGVGLLVKQADCQAVVLYDPVRRALANLHVGWRGNVADMPGAGVAFMAGRYGSDPADIIAAVSPSLGPCCAEFVNHRRELPAGFAAYQVRPNHFDLWAVTVDQLAAAGVRRDRVEVAGICTKCDQRFFSYRREGRTGRFGTVAALVEA